MLIRPIQISLTILLLMTQASIAQAGPLRDAIQNRRAARAQSQDAEAFQENEFSRTARTTVLPAEAKLLPDMAYGTDPKQRMDVYLPAHPDHAPVIFMVHGGAWRSGDKTLSRVTQNKVSRWVSRGFVFVSVNYRLLPGADPATQASDVARALATAQSRAAQWGADPAKFIVMGHSAGAHLVSLITANPEMAIQQGARPWLGTVSLDTAAMNIVSVMQKNHYRFYDTAFGADQAYWQSTSPYHQLKPSAPPMLLICSSVRPDKPCSDTQNHANKARELGIRAEVLPFALKHSAINEQLGLPGAYTDAVETFMKSLDAQVMQLLTTTVKS